MHLNTLLYSTILYSVLTVNGWGGHCEWIVQRYKNMERWKDLRRILVLTDIQTASSLPSTYDMLSMKLTLCIRKETLWPGSHTA